MPSRSTDTEHSHLGRAAPDGSAGQGHLPAPLSPLRGRPLQTLGLLLPSLQECAAIVVHPAIEHTRDQRGLRTPPCHSHEPEAGRPAALRIGAGPGQAAGRGTVTQPRSQTLLEPKGGARNSPTNNPANLYPAEGERVHPCYSSTSSQSRLLPGLRAVTHLCGFPPGSATPSPPSGAGFSASSALLCGSLCRTQRELEERKGRSLWTGRSEQLRRDRSGPLLTGCRELNPVRV